MLDCALSIDDAPATEPLDLATEGAATMDAVRETLQKHAIPHCVAFVIGARARGHEAALERWLAAGYELGNHTETHVYASRVGVDAFIAAFEQCDQLLTDVGAFRDGKPRYFRHPFGDRGADPRERARIRRMLGLRGYTVADVSISLRDYLFEGPLAEALLAGDPNAVALIEQRYAQHARESFARGTALAVPLGFVHIANAHFGRVTARTLDSVLTSVRSQLRILPMSSAVEHTTYRRFAETYTNNGIIADALRGKNDTAWTALARRGARLARKLKLFDQDRLGPIWPHFSE